LDSDDRHKNAFPFIIVVSDRCCRETGDESSSFIVVVSFSTFFLFFNSSNRHQPSRRHVAAIVIDGRIAQVMVISSIIINFIDIRSFSISSNFIIVNPSTTVINRSSSFRHYTFILSLATNPYPRILKPPHHLRRGLQAHSIPSTWYRPTCSRSSITSTTWIAHTKPASQGFVPCWNHETRMDTEIKESWGFGIEERYDGYLGRMGSIDTCHCLAGLYKLRTGLNAA
jgi:hypothetical protein